MAILQSSLLFRYKSGISRIHFVSPVSGFSFLIRPSFSAYHIQSSGPQAISQGTFRPEMMVSARTEEESAFPINSNPLVGEAKSGTFAIFSFGFLPHLVNNKMPANNKKSNTFNFIF